MVKQGYKQTEVGLIPEEWDIKYAESFGDIITGSTPSTENVRFWNGDTPWITPSDIQEARDIAKSERMITKEGLSAIRELPPSTLLVTCIASIGKNAVLTQKGACNQQINAIIPSNEYSVNYLYYLMEINKEYLLANSGITATRIVSKNDFAKLKFAVSTNKKEQEYIADALSDVDSMISSLERLIAKKKAVKQGTMQELLTGKKRLPGFTGEWESVSLGEIGTITGSGADKKILPDEQPITLLNYTNVYHQITIARQDLNHQVTASYEKIKNCSVMKGDVFLTPTSETPEDIALSAVALEDMEDVVYSYHVVRLRPKLNHNGAFINYALSTPMFREQAVQFAEGSGIRYVITLKKFKEMQVYLPIGKTEQDGIVSILSDMDNEIETLEQKLAKTRQIKQGMMQQLLTGKIRLV